jgi:CubicO group peptidase (beta-lactamase class C family)
VKKNIIILLLIICLALVWFCWPIYQAKAYRDKVPMLGFNFQDWPSSTPNQSTVYLDDYAPLDNQAIDLLIEQQRAVHAPGYTAAVAVNQQLVWAGSAGWADIKQKKVMTNDTQLRIGSTSKALTATGLAKLVTSGHIELDTKIENYFEHLPNRAWRNMTARQLASHMSGIPHYGKNTELLGKLQTLRAQTHYPNALDAITLFDESELRFEPGEQFSYSSLGTVLLSAIMQIQAQMNYRDFMQQAVLTPLSLTSTTVELPNEHLPNLATFYWQDKQQKSKLKPWYDLDLSHRLAGGGWVSTSKDLALLGQAFLNDAYIPTSVRDEFWTPQRLNSGEVNKQNYGLGWRVHTIKLDDRLAETLYIHHGGVSAGAQSFLLVLPEYQLSIAVNANIRTEVFSDFAAVSLKLARLFALAIQDKLNETTRQTL